MRVGVLGGGQLGRMLALAGYRLGIDCRFLDPNGGAAACQVAELISGPFEEEGALETFADRLDALTYEFENVPVACLEALRGRAPEPAPPIKALATSQDRLLEKSCFQSLDIPTASFVPVNDRQEMEQALKRIGRPAVLKTRRMGYDGRGQILIRTAADALNCYDLLPQGPLILECFVPFQRELSIIAVRSTTGETAFYPLVENHHEQGILRLSQAPAPGADSNTQELAQDYATRLLDHFDYAGVMAIEFFMVDGKLLANEMAPRVHNSGHWTIEGAVTSQFENHLRAILGWPLGSTEATGHAAMINILGTPPATAEILEERDARLHLYGKTPAPRRKIGHVTLVAQGQMMLRPGIERMLALVRKSEAPGKSQPPAGSPGSQVV